VRNDDVARQGSDAFESLDLGVQGVSFPTIARQQAAAIPCRPRLPGTLECDLSVERIALLKPSQKSQNLCAKEAMALNISIQSSDVSL
jgi:hypothetical protein